MTQKNVTHYKEIDRLRGYAILLVIWTHIFHSLIAEYFRDQFVQTWTGVDLFFVISGFVVTNSLLKLQENAYLENSSVSKFKIWLVFVKRRFTRILPVAWLWILIPVGLFLILTKDWNSPLIKLLFRDAFHALTFTYNYFMDPQGQGELNYFWSLCVEEHFYIILPLVILFIKTRSRQIKTCCLLILLVGLGRSFVFNSAHFSNQDVHCFSNNRFDSLFFGVVVALAYEQLNLFANKLKLSSWILKLIYWTLCIFIFFYGGIARSEDILTYGLTLLALASAALVFGATQNKGYVFELPWGASKYLEIIGTRSYSLYLIHTPCIRLTASLLGPLWRMGHPEIFTLGVISTIKVIFFLVLTALVTEINYRFVERPLIKRSRNIGFAQVS